jgi:two-component system, response regulator
MKTRDVEILLVEDNLDDANLTIRALQKKNLANNILHLKDGAEALDFFFGKGEYAGRDLEEKPRLVLLDLNLPKVSGIEVLEKLKSHERTKTIPVVVLTSSQEDPDIHRCYALGVNSYIVKPVVFENLVATVVKLGMYWLVINERPQ